MDYSKPKIGDYILSDGDEFFTSGSINRRYKVAGVYDDKIHFVQDTGYYKGEMDDGYINVKYLEPYEALLERLNCKIHYPDDTRSFFIPLETLRNNFESIK